MNTRYLLRFFLFLLFAAVLVAGVSAASPDVEDAVEKGLSYLSGHQNTDGGFIEPNTDKTSISATWFTTQALVAAGEDPLSAKWTKNGKTPLDYLIESPDGKSDGTGEIAKWITFAAACGKDPYTFADYDAVAALQEKIKEDGRVGNYIYTTYWGIFGLTAAGADVEPQIAWLLTQQNADGSFGSYGTETGDSGDADNTAASIMALRAAGIPADDPAVEAAVQFLREAIEENGGYNYGYYSAPNLASTAWAVQAFCSVGIDPSTVKSSAGNSPVDYLLSLQKEDGSFRYTETLTDTPVGMTARAVAALSGCAYPILPGQKVLTSKAAPYRPSSRRISRRQTNRLFPPATGRRLRSPMTSAIRLPSPPARKESSPLPRQTPRFSLQSAPETGWLRSPSTVPSRKRQQNSRLSAGIRPSILNGLLPQILTLSLRTMETGRRM